jgi:hypothetical protein
VAPDSCLPDGYTARKSSPARSPLVRLVSVFRSD